MNTHRVTMPNGNCLTIEGGDAQAVANVINNGLARNVVDEAGAAEEPYEMPVMNFGKATVTGLVTAQAPSNQEGEEKPLALPSMG